MHKIHTELNEEMRSEVTYWKTRTW